MAESRVHRLLCDGRLLPALTVAVAVLAFLGPLSAYDVWWHLKAGRVILESGRVPHADPFSFTAFGRPWTYHSWLSGVALAGVWALGGTVALVIFRALMTTASLLVAWALARRRGVDSALACVFVLAACLQLRVRTLARPYLFSFVLFAVFATMLQRAVQSAPDEGEPDGVRYWLWGRGGRLALMVPLTRLWANLHAGFLSGFLLLGAYGVGEMVRVASVRSGRPYPARLLRGAEGARFRAMFAVGAVALPASFVTPYGPGAFTYSFRLLGTVKMVRRIQEWRPVPFEGDYMVFWALFGIGVVILMRSAWSIARGGRLRQEAGQLATDVLLFAGFGLLAIRGVRHVTWLLLLVPSLLGYHLGVAPREEGERRPKLIYGVAVVVLAAAVGLSPFTKGRVRLFGIDEAHIPVKACDFMERHGLVGRPFNSYEWGGYLIWRFWPPSRVFIDGRALLYGDRLIKQYIQVSSGREGWQDVLAGYDVEVLLLNHRMNPTAHFFEDGRWRCVYWDDLATIAVRDDVLAREGERLMEFTFSNPAVVDHSLTEGHAAEVLAEVDAVLKRGPQCWTALAFRARALAALAADQPKRRHELLTQALEAARQALELEERQAAPWQAMAEVARAVGSTELAEKAERNAEKYRRRWP